MTNSKCPVCGYAKPDIEKVISTIQDMLRECGLAYEMSQEGDYVILKINNVHMAI